MSVFEDKANVKLRSIIAHFDIIASVHDCGLGRRLGGRADIGPFGVNGRYTDKATTLIS